MELTFEQRYPFPVDDVLKCVIEKELSRGAKLSISEKDPSNLLTIEYEATILEEAEIRVPRQLNWLFPDTNLQWQRIYTWNPIKRIKTWRIEPLTYKNRVRAEGTSSYREDSDEDGYCIRWTNMEIEANVPGLNSIIEEKVKEKVIKGAEEEFQLIMSTLGNKTDPSRNTASDTLVKGEIKMKSTTGSSANRAVFGLLPFWLGTITTSLGAGYFMAGSEQSYLIPYLFLGLVISLFGVAFVTTGPERKNVLGFFLALFSVCFWIGTYLVKNWP